MKEFKNALRLLKESADLQAIAVKELGVVVDKMLEPLPGGDEHAKRAILEILKRDRVSFTADELAQELNLPVMHIIPMLIEMHDAGDLKYWFVWDPANRAQRVNYIYPEYV